MNAHWTEIDVEATEQAIRFACNHGARFVVCKQHDPKNPKVRKEFDPKVNIKAKGAKTYYDAGNQPLSAETVIKWFRAGRHIGLEPFSVRCIGIDIDGEAPEACDRMAKEIADWYGCTPWMSGQSISGFEDGSGKRHLLFGYGPDKDARFGINPQNRKPWKLGPSSKMLWDKDDLATATDSRGWHGYLICTYWLPSLADSIRSGWPDTSERSAEFINRCKANAPKSNAAAAKRTNTDKNKNQQPVLPPSEYPEAFLRKWNDKGIAAVVSRWSHKLPDDGRYQFAFDLGCWAATCKDWNRLAVQDARNGLERHAHNLETKHYDQFENGLTYEQVVPVAPPDYNPGPPPISGNEEPAGPDRPSAPLDVTVQSDLPTYKGKPVRKLNLDKGEKPKIVVYGRTVFLKIVDAFKRLGWKYRLDRSIATVEYRRNEKRAYSQLDTQSIEAMHVFLSMRCSYLHPVLEPVEIEKGKSKKQVVAYEEKDFVPQFSVYSRVIHAVATVNAIDPIQDFIQSIPDWQPDFGDPCWELFDNFGVEDTPLNRFMSVQIWVGAYYYNRGGHPEPLRPIGILAGPQNSGKSATPRSMFPPALQAILFGEGFDLAADDKMKIEAVRGKMLAEAAEIQKYSGRTVESFKAFSQRMRDNNVRMAYARGTDRSMDRTCWIVGTSDKPKDCLPTDGAEDGGNTRFVGIEITKGFHVEAWMAHHKQPDWPENRMRIWAQLKHYTETTLANRGTLRMPRELEAAHRKAVEAQESVSDPMERTVAGITAEMDSLRADECKDGVPVGELLYTSCYIQLMNGGRSAFDNSHGKQIHLGRSLAKSGLWEREREAKQSGPYKGKRLWHRTDTLCPEHGYRVWDQARELAKASGTKAEEPGFPPSGKYTPGHPVKHTGDAAKERENDPDGMSSYEREHMEFLHGKDKKPN